MRDYLILCEIQKIGFKPSKAPIGITTRVEICEIHYGNLESINNLIIYFHHIHLRLATGEIATIITQSLLLDLFCSL